MNVAGSLFAHDRFTHANLKAKPASQPKHSGPCIHCLRDARHPYNVVSPHMAVDEHVGCICGRASDPCGEEVGTLGAQQRASGEERVWGWGYKSKERTLIEEGYISTHFTLCSFNCY